MKSRREFLCTAIRAVSGASVTLLLTPLVGGCDDDETASPVATADPTEPACDGVGGTSTVELQHSHTVCVPVTDLANPPGARTYRTSPAITDGHVHLLELSGSELSRIALGQSVIVTTAVAMAHTHAFELRVSTPSTPAPSAPPREPLPPY